MAVVPCDIPCGFLRGVAVGLGCTVIVSLCVLCILILLRKHRKKAKETATNHGSKSSRKSSIITVSEWDGSTRGSQKINRYRKNRQHGESDDSSMISSKSLPLRTNSQSRDNSSSSLRINNVHNTGSRRPNSNGDIPTNNRRSSLKNMWNYTDPSTDHIVHNSSVYVTGSDVTFAPFRGHDLPNSGATFTNDGRLVVDRMPSLAGQGSLRLKHHHSIYK